MIDLLHPWAAVLSLPLAWAWWRWGRGALQGAFLLLLLLAALGPTVRHGDGSDVILVLDRSRSMADAGALAPQDELVRLAAQARGPDDRLGVVALGDGAVLVAAPQARSLPDLSQATLADDASDLAEGLDLARSLITRHRQGRLVLVSDGEDTGRDPRPVVLAAARDGVRVDVLPAGAPGSVDAAIAHIELPRHLRLGESTLGAVRLVSDRSESRTWSVTRGTTLVAQGEARLRPGTPVTVTFADRPPLPGLVRYAIRLDDRDDRQPGNNRAEAVLMVEGGERVLVIGGDGRPGNAARALEAAGLRTISRPEGPLSLGDLAGVTAVVLEQVPAGSLGLGGQQALATWVRQAGGGLVVTGGRRSFGGGGWHRSPLEEVLPVTCEVRDEHRKLAVALAIALDRSGSMAATLPDGRTKIALADEGACAAIELLSARDRVAVLAVDTSPHVVVPLTSVADRGPILAAVRGIVSEGGGIYVRAGLEGAASQVLAADTGTRHIVVFADASDSEDQAGCEALIADLVKTGVTVSVVAMGSPGDSDAAFLRQVAQWGGGRCHFVEQVQDLPRIFAQETLLVARATWVDGPIQPTTTPTLALAIPGLPPLPPLAGFNLTYLRDRAERWAWCPGDPMGPAAAAWRIGTGRCVALPFDHEDLGTWNGRAALLAGAARWAAGTGAPRAALEARRTGRHVELVLTAAPEAQVSHEATLLGPEGQTLTTARLVRTGSTTWEGRMTLASGVIALPVVAVDGHAVRAAPVMLPYHPEAAPRLDQAPGAALLDDLARLGQGTVRRDLSGLYDGLPPAPGARRALAPWLVLAALLLLGVEIAIRRLGLPDWRRTLRTSPVRPPAPTPTSSPVAPPTSLGDALRSAKQGTRPRP